jgi:hypothetical protein
VVADVLSLAEFPKEESKNSFEDLLSDLWGECIQDAVLGNTDLSA